MLRLFVGLALPYELRTRLSGLIAHRFAGAKWVPPENYHLTLRFIGEVDNGRADDIDAGLSAIAARGFDLTLAGVGTFETRGRPHALWVGVERNAALEHLRAKVESAVVRAGCEPERRRFVPHVTLARLDNPDPIRLGEFLRLHGLFRAEPVPVERFTLFSSHLAKDQAHYTAEADYALA
ncbi:MAG: RNA 2',3'-cyclic phosphodiesterase [Elioraea sp.]|nr:RNA 2',3'-cyclic phosphodiesterase [Elioraea sp.]MDW8445310.1 RNA 2',3'-cyclic phosphodiesterase [Acetobacteraceae bacterium]